MAKNLIFTIAFDRTGEPYHQSMAKILVSSIFRTGYVGNVLVLTNSDHRLYEYGRPGLEEISLDTSALTDSELGLKAQQFKYRAREYVSSLDFDRVMFMDCDCICQRNPDDLVRGDADILFSEEPAFQITSPFFSAYLRDDEMRGLAAPGMNSGLWAVRGACFQDLMEEWERIDTLPPLREKLGADQPAWVRLLRDTKLRAEPFRIGIDVHFPMLERRSEFDFQSATVLHFNGAPPPVKLAHMCGVYMRRFHVQTCMTLLGLLDG